MAGPHRQRRTIPIEHWPELVPAPGPILVEPRRPATEPVAWPRTHRWSWVESAVLAGYTAVVALGIRWHEPWADEGQAWLMARDQGFWHLLLHSVRYEGSPGLWHALLWVLVRLHLGFTAMHWVAGAMAAAGIVVLLRWSPFPLVLRVLLPFGFWLAYQNAVVARSYVLFAGLAFGAAALLRGMAARERLRDSHSYERRLLGLALLLGLMANLSVHGFVASLGFAVVARTVVRRRIRAGAHVRRAIPAVLLACFWIFAVVTTLPPGDVNFAAGKNLERSTQKILAGLGSKQAKAELRADRDLPNDVRLGELTPAPGLTFHRTRADALWHKVARVLSLLTFPVSNFRWLALLVCGLVVAQAFVFRASRHCPQLGWVGLAPWASMVVVFTSVYMAPRHAGMLWIALVASLWLTWPARESPTNPARWLQHLTVAALVLVALDQAWWAGRSVWEDMHQPYSGDSAMANFLEAQPKGERIAGFYYHTVGPVAFLHRPVYFNQPSTYWVWSRNLRTNRQAPATIATHPGLIVVGGFEWSARNGDITDDWLPPVPAELNRVPLADAFGIIPYAEAHGYRETHRFCGHAFMRDGYAEYLCQVALQPVR